MAQRHTVSSAVLCALAAFSFCCGPLARAEVAAPSASLAEALALANTKQYEASKHLLERLIAEKPDDALLWFNLGTIAFNLGTFSDAAFAFKSVIQRHSPLSLAAKLCLAKTYRKQSQWEQAVQTLEQVSVPDRAALSALFEGEQREVARMLRDLGLRTLAEGEEQKALELFELSLRLEDNAEAVYSRALALSLLGRTTEAKLAFRKFLKEAVVDASFIADARYFLHRLDVGISGRQPFWLSATAAGGTNSNVFFSGTSDSPTSAPVASADLLGAWQPPSADTLFARLTYTASLLENIGHSAGRWSSQSAGAEVGYVDASLLLALAPSLTYQTFGTDPYRLQGTLSARAEHYWQGWGIGLHYQIDKNYGQTTNYSYLNGYSHWGEAQASYFDTGFEMRISLIVLADDIHDLHSGTTLLPLRDIGLGPALKIFWNPASTVEIAATSTYLFRNYSALAEPDTRPRSDEQSLSSLKVTYRFASHVSAFVSGSFILNTSTLGATSSVSDRNYTQLFSLLGISWNALN